LRKRDKPRVEARKEATRVAQRGEARTTQVARGGEEVETTNSTQRQETYTTKAA